jgi:hypothetical protein
VTATTVRKYGHYDPRQRRGRQPTDMRHRCAWCRRPCDKPNLKESTVHGGLLLDPNCWTRESVSKFWHDRGRHDRLTQHVLDWINHGPNRLPEEPRD